MANSDGVEFRLFDTDLTSVLHSLRAQAMQINLILNEPGNGAVTIALKSRAAVSAESAMFVEGKYRGGVRGGFFVEGIDKSITTRGENGEQLMALMGRGALALLDDAIVWGDGTSATTQEFTGTRAGMLISMIDAAQARGALLNLSYDFSSVVDSTAAAWTDNESLSWSNDTSLLDVARDIAKAGIDLDILPDGAGNFVLSAYKNGKGTDKSETVYFRVGKNCTEVSSLEDGSEIRNALKVSYQSGKVIVSDATSISVRRRREYGLNARAAQTAESATTIGAAELELRKDPRKSIDVAIDDGVGPRLFVDYELGDYIMLDIEGVETKYRVRGIKAAWDGKKFANVVVNLNSIILENEILMGQDINWLLDQWETARDAGLLEVSYWAAIGDANTDYSSVMMVVVGDALYLINGVMSNRMMRFTFGTGVWEVVTVALGTINCMEVIGTTIYLGGQSAVYKFETSTDTLSTIAAISYAASPALTGAYTMAVDGTTLYIAGAFDTIDGVAANGIIKYNTVADTWATLADEASFTFPTVASMSSMVFANGNLYANGQMWNGTVFSSTSKPGTIGFCYKMIAYGTDILIGTEDGLYIYDGVSWEVFGGTIAGQVRDIAIYLTDIYIVGTFTDIGNRIAKYSGGAWWQLGSGLNGSTTQIELVDDDVYVMGSFTTAGDKAANNIAAYFSNFESMVDYLENSSSSFNMGAAIHGATASAISDSDEIPFWEDVANALRKITWANIKATLKTYFDTLLPTQAILPYTTGGTSTAYTLTTTATSVALTTNERLYVIFHATAGVAPTLNRDGKGAKTLKYYDSTGAKVACGATTILANMRADVIYDGTDYVVLDMIPIIGGGGTPGGSDTQVQFNDGGVFGGDADFNYDKTTNHLTLGKSAPVVADDNVFELVGDGAEPARFRAYGYDDSSSGTIPGYTTISGGGTRAAPTRTPSGKIVGRFSFGGYDDDTPPNPLSQGFIYAVATDDWTTTSRPIKLQLWITKPGEITYTLAAEFLDDGSISFPAGNVNIASGKTYNVNGSPHVHVGLVTNGDSHDHNGGGGAQIAHGNLSSIGTKTHAQIDNFLAGMVPSWTAPSLSNSWVNYGGTYAPAGYWKDAAGIVHLRGLVKSGTIGMAVFTLPIGYRPAYTFEVLVDANAAVGICVINTSGTVVAAAGSNAYFSLDGITIFT